MGGILKLWILSLLCILPWHSPLASEELSEKWPSGRWCKVYKPGMFVQSGNGSALTKGNEQAAAREKKDGSVQQCENCEPGACWLVFAEPTGLDRKSLLGV